MIDDSIKSGTVYKRLIRTLGISPSYIKGPSSPVENCVFYQTVLQIVFGFILPCCVAYVRELNARIKFLERNRIRVAPETPNSLDVLMRVPIFFSYYAVLLLLLQRDK